MKAKVFSKAIESKGGPEDHVEFIKKGYLEGSEGNIIDAYDNVCRALFIKDMYMDIVLNHPSSERIKYEPKFAQTFFDAVEEHEKKKR